jgi:hypothetical protein
MLIAIYYATNLHFQKQYPAAEFLTASATIKTSQTTQYTFTPKMLQSA